MADLSKKRLGEIKQVILKVLNSAPDGIPAKQIPSRIEPLLPFTEFEKSFYETAPNVRRIDKIVRFATIGPVKAGWMTKEKGIWRITTEGSNVLEKIKDPEKLTDESNRLYKKWSSSNKNADSALETEVDIAAEEVAEKIFEFEESEEAAWAQISEYLKKINPYDFQFLVAGLFKSMGYHINWISPPGKDGGLDIIAYNDPIGVTNPRIKIQVKRRQDKIQVEELRSFMALLGEHDVGIFVNTGGFTSGAESEARGSANRRITLIDQERLYDLWVENYDKISDEYKKHLPLRPVYFLNLDP